MKKIGIIGFPLKHSFSQRYFTDKFKREGIDDFSYSQYEIDNISELSNVLKDSEIVGFNVTIPYKEQIIPFLSQIDSVASEIGAVNCVKCESGHLIGYNTDIYGFENSLLELISDKRPKALVFGTGGASKAVCYVLAKIGVEYLIVSRKSKQGVISYEECNERVLKEYKLLINTTPLGTFPDVNTSVNIPYEMIDKDCYAYDLVYNPADTQFIREARHRGAKVMSGYKMLVLQAEKGWDIFKTDSEK